MKLTSVLLFSVLFSQGALATNIDPKQFPAGGGDGAGGGNVQASTKPPSILFKMAAENLEKALVPIFRGWEYQLITTMNYAKTDFIEKIYYDNKEFTVDIREVKRKVFNAKPSIYEILKAVKFDVRENGPCLDKNNVETDASIYNMPANTICISGERLSQKLSMEAVNRGLISLASHEVVHLVTKENDDVIPNYAQTRLGQVKEHVNFHSIGSAYLNTASKIKNVIRHLDWFFDGIVAGRSAYKMCMGLPSLQTYLDELFHFEIAQLNDLYAVVDARYTYGTRVLSMMALGTAAGYCLPEDDADAKDMEKWLKRKMSSTELSKSYGPYPVSFNLTLDWPRFQNTDDLLKNLGAIKKVVLKHREALKAEFPPFATDWSRKQFDENTK